MNSFSMFAKFSM